MTEKDFQDVLTTFDMKQLMRGMSTGLNVAAMAYQDALERAEFVGFPLMVDRVMESIDNAFADTPFQINRKSEDEEEADDGAV